MGRGSEKYRRKVALAPMVRIGTLPSRLLALKHGADLVYTEEIIDFKMLQAKRVSNDAIGTVDYITKDGTLAFRTCSTETEKLIYQMGTADAKRALKVARMVEQDVMGIDINMGCPKEFSIKGGMGAALLTQPEKIKQILTTLVNGVSIPITCKIRILPTMEENLELVKLIESTGVAAIGIHGRLRDERQSHSNHNDVIAKMAAAVDVPVIANGGSKDNIKCYEDIEKFRKSCGASSVMIARSAAWNNSIFSPEGLRPIQEVVRDYLPLAIKYDSLFHNCKYNIQYMMHDELECDMGHRLMATKTMQELCVIWDMLGYYQEIQNNILIHQQQTTSMGVKKRKLDDGREIKEMPMECERSMFESNVTPKSILNNHCKDYLLDTPKYATEESAEHYFHSIVTVAGCCYATTLWIKSKKWAEQAAARVCLHVLGIPDRRKQTPAEQALNKASNCDGSSQITDNGEIHALKSTAALLLDVERTTMSNHLENDNRIVSNFTSENGAITNTEVDPRNTDGKLTKN